MQLYIWKRRGRRPNFAHCVFFVLQFFEGVGSVFFSGRKKCNNNIICKQQQYNGWTCCTIVHVSLYLRNYIDLCMCICICSIYLSFVVSAQNSFELVLCCHAPTAPLSPLSNSFALWSRRLPPFGLFFTQSDCLLFLFRHFSVFLFFSVFSPNCFSFNFISLSAQTFQLIVQLFKRKQYRALSSAHKVWKLRSQVKKKSVSESESRKWIRNELLGHWVNKQKYFHWLAPGRELEVSK